MSLRRLPRWHRPVPHRISSPWGWRTIGKKAPEFHRGTDFACPEGTNVESVASGTVVKLFSDSLNGIALRVKHDDGTSAGYAHLSYLLKGQGMRVERGEPIAKSGNTGRSTAPHLHLSAFTAEGKRMDPELLLRHKGRGSAVGKIAAAAAAVVAVVAGGAILIGRVRS